MMNMIISLLIAAALFHFPGREYRQQPVPVLCYHNLYIEPGGKNTLLSISRERFREQVQSLRDSGYHTISPDQLYAYLTHNAPLPPKPVMITFDDTRAAHYSIAAPVLNEYGYKGVFFIMTVAIGKPGYMTSAQIKALAGSGHIIGSHTWDHPHLNKAIQSEWKQQLDNPKRQLERITGKPVWYFAYPFGEWNAAVVQELKRLGFKAAFQLNGKESAEDKIYTLRRMMVAGYWSGTEMQRAFRATGKALPGSLTP
jgi:peptidoglycan/xylan/chitin deacetylase (PgdA/CDA1 family)